MGGKNLMKKNHRNPLDCYFIKMYMPAIGRKQTLEETIY